MTSYQLLDQREEDELHKSRLLNVEEKPFKRITKRLLSPGSLVITPSKLPTPPLDTTEEAGESDRQKFLDERRQLREDVLLDFAAFDSSLARIQFLRNSNERERERYKADKEHILETAQAVRDSTAQLRIQLEEAKKTLEQRKKFDELAEKITNNMLLRPRKDQEINLRKLEEECKELERESRTYGETWKERREQFGRIVEEGMQLRRLIRDEKEEVERREGMDGGEEDGEVGDGQTPRRNSASGDATPRQGSPERGTLKPRPMPSGSMSRPDSRSGSRSGSRPGSRSGSRGRSKSRIASPTRSERARSRRRREEDGDDFTMEDANSRQVDMDPTADTHMADGMNSTQEGTPQVTINEPEEGAVDEGEIGDKMDTT
ncbi:f548b020-7561-4216-9d25-8ff78c92886c [Sclerotinia trifoliorum]|uniref:F548b020-7561-4216-9d25-8ff78c92886c n=1 Tax=Sclerotinia trifoliorum TaxID=28548 RepID=A0A8H2W6K0_9HELO|nr:f548b020-7561-4216-9d25-8ff78c92886c [Sclerotinia trifoliorum]